MYRMIRDGWRGPVLPHAMDAGKLHWDAPNSCAWSRANVEEANPGVLTPLTWSFTEPSTITGSRMIFSMMGVLSRREAQRPPLTPSDYPTALFYGRMAANVDYFRRLLARVPGGDPDGFERQILGSLRGRPAEPKHRWRLPIVLANVTINVRRFPAQTEVNRRETERWWRHETTAVTSYSLDQAVALFDDAAMRHMYLVAVHVFGFFVGQGHYSKLATLCAEVGLPGHELELTGSGEGTEETAMVDDIRRLARGEAQLEGFLLDHGYRGPDEGELSSRSWREDPAPIAQLVDLYHRHDVTPVDTATRFAASRSALLDRLSRRDRAKTGKLIDRVVSHMHLRETGKASFVTSKDVARAAARRIGELLCAEGLLDDPEDVFMLTRTELGAPTAYPLRETVRLRRSLRDQYQALELPDHFDGIPDAVALDTIEAKPLTSGEVISGMAASTGCAEGVARIVHDAADFGDFAPDDVLVCALTDPAWAPLMQMSCAVVIDIGGPLSHGAIVARELGIPAVIGTGDGTARIPDGAKVRVDGTAGSVTIV